MPYQGDNQTISMFIFLPNESTSIAQLLDGLTAKVLDFVFNEKFSNTPEFNIYSKELDIIFPKISLEKESLLKPVC